MISRREVLKLSAAAAIPLMGNWASGAEPPLRTRKAISTLTEDSPDVVALRTAVEKMKGADLTPNDKRRWDYQAHIHGNAMQFTHCQHANYFFFPWHRAYLYYFESIVRTLSGNDQFALPYWDWTHQYVLPSQFWTSGSALTDSSRRSGLTSSTQFSAQDIDGFVGQTVISNLLGIDDFETFAGSAVAHAGDHAQQGALESGPHNFVHRWVGGQTGDMVTGQSPLDPIFWLHHCNIDRLWSEWALRHPKGAPSDALWAAQQFDDFVDGAGKPVSVKVSQLLDTAPLGYQYDTRSPVRLTTGVGAPVLASWSSVASFTDTKALIGKIVIQTSDIQKEAIATSLSDLQHGKPASVRLSLKNVPIIGNGDYAVQVFVNCKKLTADTPVNDPSYVASFTFFGPHSHAAGLAEKPTISVFLDVTPAFARLYGDRVFTASEPLDVWLRLRPLFPDSGVLIPETILQVTPSKVSVDVLG